VYLISVTRGAHRRPSGQYINKLAPLMKCVVVTVRRAVGREMKRVRTVCTYYVINFVLITRGVAVILLV
jgi:hypothetical protein